MRRIIIYMAILLTVPAFAPDGAGSKGATPQSLSDNRLFRVNALIGSTLRNRQGRELGVVEDFLLGKNDGRITYIILSEKNDSGAAVMVPLPWGKISPSINGGNIVVNLDRAKLENAPTFRDWADLLQPNSDLKRRINAYYDEKTLLKPPINLKIVK